MTVAAPGPVFGADYEAVRDRVAVDVTELFDKFFLGEDVAVKVAALPGAVNSWL